MTGFNIVMVIAIILFARLGMRLFLKWKELENSDPGQQNSQQKKELDRENDQLDK